MWYRSILILTLLLLSPAVFSDGGNAGQLTGSLSHDDDGDDPLEGYVAPGPFYWTRLSWKGTGDASMRGALYFVDENGNQSRTNLFLIAGMKGTAHHAVRYHEKALESLGTYRTPLELFPQRKDLDDFTTAVRKSATKPWGLVTHKAEKIKESAIRNYDDMNDPNVIAKWGFLGKIAITVWNGLQTIGETLWIGGVELPAEFALRVVPKYWVGVSFDTVDGVVPRNGLITSTVKPVLRPVLPVLGATWYWGVLEPSNLALRGGPSVAAGAAGTLLTGVTAVVEGGKFLVWDSWHPTTSSTGEESALYQTKDGKNVGFIIPVPADEQVDNAVKAVFQSENLKDGYTFVDRFERVISENPDKKWVVMSYIVSRLAETIHSLLENSTKHQWAEIYDAHQAEAAELAWVKDVYSWALKEEMEWKN